MDTFLPTAVTHVLDRGLEWIYSLEPYVAPTVFLVPGFVRAQVQVLADNIGFDAETLNYTLGLFLCYPLGMIMNALPYGPMRHVFSFLLGAFLMQFTLGVQWIHQVITSLIVYGMFLVLPRKANVLVVPTFVMLYCVLGHLHRQYVNYLAWDLDFTGTQMVLTQKLYMMAFNLYDGEALQGNKPSPAAQKCAPYALKKVPNLIEYLGYTFCFANVLSGPAFEFATYNNICNGSLLYDANGKPRGKIPSNVWPTLRPLLVSVLNLVIFVVLGAYFPLLDPTDPQKNTPVVLQPGFLARSWLFRYAYMWMGLVVVRQKYYFAWMNAEGANNIWYAGFEGFDEKGNAKEWNNCSNVDIPKFETAPSVQILSKEWNKKTSLWLTRYVYIRTNGSLVAVYSLSAFWHGFYPGYYLFFLSVPMMTFCERLGRKKLSPYFAPGGALYSPMMAQLYYMACVVVTSMFAEYMVSTFVLLALDRAWANWKSHYFFGHVGCIVFYLLISLVPTPKNAKKVNDSNASTVTNNGTSTKKKQ